MTFRTIWTNLPSAGLIGLREDIETASYSRHRQVPVMFHGSEETVNQLRRKLGKCHMKAERASYLLVQQSRETTSNSV